MSNGERRVWRVGGCALAGAILAAAPAAGQDASPFEPTRYELEVRVDYETGEIGADVAIALRNGTEEPAGRVPILLNRLLTVREVTDPSGHPLRFVQDVVAFTDEPRMQVTAVQIELPRPVAPGDSAVVRVSYDGFLTGYAETGALYIRDSVNEDYTVIRMDAYAYPRLGVPTDSVNRRAGLPTYDYQARIDVPAGYVVANGGELVDRTEVGDRVIWHYRSRVPSWRMDFPIARYGRLEFDDITVFYLPGDSTGAERLVRAAQQAHEAYSEWFGPLQHPVKLAIIEVPDGLGSQKDATAILQVASAFRDPSQLRQMYHEVAHGWTPVQGGLAPRVEEGLATFLEYLTSDRLDGTSRLKEEEEVVAQRLRTWFTDRPEFSEVPMADYGERRWTSLSYSVGFLMYAILFDVMGQDEFNTFVGEYYRCCNEGDASTRRLAEEIARAGGPAASQVLQDWLWTTDWWPMVRDGWTLERMANRYVKGSAPADGPRG